MNLWPLFSPKNLDFPVGNNAKSSCDHPRLFPNTPWITKNGKNITFTSKK